MNPKTFIETIKISLKERMAYRIDLIIDVLIGPFIFLAVQFLWTNIYSYNNITELNGFSLNDSISYIAVSTIVGYFVWTWIAGNVGHKIHKGDYARFVILPLDFLGYSLADAFGHKLPSIIIKLPLLFALFYFVFKIHLTTNITYLILFFASLIFSFLLFNIFMFIMGLFTFWQESFWVFNMMGFAAINFLSGSLLPLEFYPPIIRGMIDILPFKHIYYSPIMIYLERYSIESCIQVIVSQLIFVIILYLIAGLVLKLGRARFTSTGG